MSFDSLILMSRFTDGLQYGVLERGQLSTLTPVLYSIGCGLSLQPREVEVCMFYPLG